MTSRESGSRAKRSVSVSVVLGTLLVPLSAYAASVLVDRSTDTEPQLEVTVTSGSIPVESASALMSATIDDLTAACGEVGLGMVAVESNGSITDLQQAALDALRQICAEQGLVLPAKTTPPPATESVVLAETPSLPDSPASPTPPHPDDDDDHDNDYDHDDDHDDHHDDDDDRDHDDEDDD